MVGRNRIEVGAGTAKVYLTRGKVALIDAEDVPLVSRHRWWSRRSNTGRRDTWYASAEGRMVGGVRGPSRQMHRLVLGLSDPEVLVDHANHNGLDNRKRNLRVCGKTGNAANARVPIDNSSGFVGVSEVQRAKANRWRAYIQEGGRFRHLGFFDTPEEAALVRDAAAIRIHGEFAFLNFPEARRGE